MSAHLFVEGCRTGAFSKNDKIRCREAFSKLLQASGFKGKLPGITPCGGRGNAFKFFKIAHRESNASDFIALLIDSEDPVDDIQATWKHLKGRTGDEWDRPTGATDEQVLFMTTTMETWIATDRDALKSFFGQKLQPSALPPLVDLEKRDRKDVLERLKSATTNCTTPYSKGTVSFKLLATLNPETLKKHLPSFVRLCRILNERL